MAPVPDQGDCRLAQIWSICAHRALNVNCAVCGGGRCRILRHPEWARLLRVAYRNGIVVTAAITAVALIFTLTDRHRAANETTTA
jgi:hypothetical protein